MWRPKEGWTNGWETEREHDGMSSKAEIYEAGADALLEAQKAEGLHGTYGEDFIISAKVKKETPDWAEPFFVEIDEHPRGTLIFIKDEEEE